MPLAVVGTGRALTLAERDERQARHDDRCEARSRGGRRTANHFALREYFTLHGYLVDTASDLTVAKDWLGAKRYSAVIADYRLSGTTSQEGLELVSFIKTRHPLTKIVMLTAYGSPHVERSACSKGVDAFSTSQRGSRTWSARSSNWRQLIMNRTDSGRNETRGAMSISHSNEFLPGLECVVAEQRLVIPSAAVQQIIEYEVSSLPLSQGHIGGAGVHAGKVVISLRLCGWEAPAPGCRPAKGVLLAVTRPTAGWVVEVSEVVAFVDAVPEPAKRTHRWTCNAVTNDGRSVAWLDVYGMLGECDSTNLEGN